MALSHLKSLQALELALRRGSLQAAARELWLTPAAVGQRIKALEDYLGVDLLLRGRSGLKPTAELAGALSLLQCAFRDLEAASAALNLQRSDEIHVAAPPDFVELWLLPRLNAFRSDHPHIAFCINGEGDAPFRVGPSDCEIRYATVRHVDHGDLLFRDFVLPVASPDIARRIARVAPRDCLEGLPLLHLDFYKDDPKAPNWPTWIAQQRLRRTSPSRGIRFQRIRTALDAALADAGIVIAGLAMLDTQLASGELTLPFPLRSGQLTAHAFQVQYRSDSLLRPQARQFRAWLIEQAQLTRQRVTEFARQSGRAAKAAKS